MFLRFTQPSVPYQHGFLAGGAVDDAMKEIVKRAVVLQHDHKSAVNQFLYLFPFSRVTIAAW